MKKIGIGYEFYKNMIDENCYFVDKTSLIQDIVQDGGKVTLFTRPRRFGKTLALTMLQAFFECEMDRNGNRIDNSHYFEGKKIMDAKDEVISMMGQYPVIFLSLKSAKQPNFASAFFQLKSDISFEISRHSYLLKSDKLEKTSADRLKKLYDSPLSSYLMPQDEARLEADVSDFAHALQILSICLKQYHGKNTIILLDEYDVPLENAYYAGFYDQMVGFIRSLFESSLKTNPTLERAVVTGCLRISRESIFTGLNHLEINTVRDARFVEGFGFTDQETADMLEYYDLSEKMPEVRKWYDGYLFGQTEIYNPWSVIKYVYKHQVSRDAFPEPYWANTSSNTIIRDLVYHADTKMREELDTLIAFETIEKKIHEEITYDDVYKNEENLWNFLFFTGYLRKVSERTEGRDIYLTMRIPNQEICSIYENQIRGWFEEIVKKTDQSKFYQAVLERDTESMGRFITSLLNKSISTFDSKESFYHGFLLSILYGTPDYVAKSNREEGDGRPDIVLYPGWPKAPAILFEIKVRKKYSEMADGICEAFTQIRDKKYKEGILDDGYNGVISFGVCFCKKSAIFEEML
ncbi:MAG: AAA family ATPase [Lachnospiraceae bacterium]|nr:AAA family ATPase [Lachnospiraceae bacterium]